MKRILILIILISVSIASNAYYFRHLGRSEGLAQNSVMAMYQDKLGRMWFGTKEGITIYDGDRMINYKPFAYNYNIKKGAQRFYLGNSVMKITGDKNGDVYMVVDNNLIKYYIEDECFEKIRENKVKDIFSYNGEIWCVVSDSLFRYDSKIRALKFYKKTNIKNINHLLISNDIYWFATESGIYIMKNNSHLLLL